MRRKGQRSDIAAIREHVAAEYESSLLHHAVNLGLDRDAGLIRARCAALRAGETVRVRWDEVPDGTLPLPPHPGSPNDMYVITSDGNWIREARLTGKLPPGTPGRAG